MTSDKIKILFEPLYYIYFVNTCLGLYDAEYRVVMYTTSQYIDFITQILNGRKS